MTVGTTNSRNAHVGNGSTTEFAFNFKVVDADDLVVTLFGDAYPATGTVATSGVDYNVLSVGPTGGSIETTATYTSAVTIEISRSVDYLQTVDFRQNDPFDADVLGNVLDRIVMMVQQLLTETQLAVSVTGAADEGVSYQLPPPEDGKFLVGNASDGWDNKTLAELGSGSVALPLAVANGGTGGATATLARTNLGLGSAAVLDTGTGAGELPTNGDLGSAAFEDAGTAGDEVLQLDSNARIPAVSARNAKDVRGFELLSEQEVAVAAGTVTSYDFTSLGSFDQFLVELIGVGVDTDGAEVALEAYDGATLYGVGGTTGKFAYKQYWRRNSANSTERGDGAADGIIVSPDGWLYDSATGGHESSFTTSILVTNNASKFSGMGSHLQWPTFNSIYGTCQFTATPGTVWQGDMWGASGHLAAVATIDGFRVRIDHGSAAYFNEGFIRIWGLTGGLWTAGNARPLHI